MLYEYSRDNLLWLNVYVKVSFYDDYFKKLDHFTTAEYFGLSS
jgi:hypothetical protein